jgi:hypothetical protein
MMQNKNSKLSHLFTQPNLSQLELAIPREIERDRNFHLGGRSFYFFDFDDNVAFLTTPLILFHKVTGEPHRISSGEFAKFHSTIGKEGPYADYEINFCDLTGTFQNFRDQDHSEVDKLLGKRQVFVKDVAEALGFPDFNWKGPSWSCFYHATFNKRPMSVITARGHSPHTIVEGISLFVEQGQLPREPEYLSIYPVSHRPTRMHLGDKDLNMGTAELKQAAIQASVEKAIEVYGNSPHHRFGMSDDDPRNLQLIIEEMTRLKNKHPEMSFFVIDTQKGEFTKHEIGINGDLSGIKINTPADTNQIKLF